ncbi:MAG: hypothetical protein ACI8Y8_000414 [Planctomycetota bacterium]|jgi:hypothetical protein
MQHYVSMLGATLATMSTLGLAWAQAPVAKQTVQGRSAPSPVQSDRADRGGDRRLLQTPRDDVPIEGAATEHARRTFARALRRSGRGSLSATEWCIEMFDTARSRRDGPPGRRQRAYSAAEARTKLRLYDRWINLWSGRLGDRTFDILGHLEREARPPTDALGREVALGLLERLAASAGVDRSAAEILLVQARHLSRSDDPTDVARARQIHDRIRLRFVGSQAARMAARAIWRDENLAIGQPAPEFVTRDVAGNEIRLSDFRGQVVVIHFWRRETDHHEEDRSLDALRELVKRHWDTPFALIGVNGDSDRDNHRVRWVEHGVVWHEAYEPVNTEGARAAWKIDDWPSTIIVDTEGMVHGLAHPGSPIARLVDPLVTRHVASLQDANDPDSQGAH